MNTFPHTIHNPIEPSVVVFVHVLLEYLGLLFSHVDTEVVRVIDSLIGYAERKLATYSCFIGVVCEIEQVTDTRLCSADFPCVVATELLYQTIKLHLQVGHSLVVLHVHSCC